jgi:hypothetical protein
MTTGPPGQDPNAQQPPWGQQPYPQQPYPQQPYPQQPYPPGQYPQQPYPPGQFPQQPYPQQQQYPPAAPPPWGLRPSAPKPGSLALRPNDVGATMSAVFSSLGNVLRSVWPGIIPLVVLSGVLGLLLSATLLVPAQREVVPTTSQWVGALVIGLPLYLLQIATSMLVLFAGVRATADAVLGRRSTVAATWQTSVRSLPRAATLFFLGVVVSLLLTGAVIALIYLGYNEHWATFTLLLVLLVVVTIAAVLLGWLKLSLTLPAMLLEGTEPISDGDPLDTRPAGLFASMGRSWRLTTGRAWRTLLIVWLMSLIAGAVVGVVSPVLQIPLSLLTAAGDESVRVTGTAVSSAIAAALSILPTLLTAITITVLYTDARIRDEQLAPAILGHVERGVPANPWIANAPTESPGAAPWAMVGVPPEQQPPYGQSAVLPE